MQVHTHVVLENVPFIAKAVLIQHLFGKKSAFFGKNSTFTQSNIVRAVLEIF